MKNSYGAKQGGLILNLAAINRRKQI